MKNKSTDLYDLLDRRWNELDSIAAPQLAQRSVNISKKMQRVGGRANKTLMALLNMHHKAWGI